MANAFPDLGQNYRIQDTGNPVDMPEVTVITDGDENPFDPKSGTMHIPAADGSVEIIFGDMGPDKKSKDFNENLAELLSDSDLSAIAEKLMLGIEQDNQSRQPWLENMANAIGLLGLQIKTPAGAAASAATPVEGTSTIDSPLLLEAVLRFQANARGELLPSDGPVKVRNDGGQTSLTEHLAEALERDLNHYLTKVAKEYYPDTDRMLLQLGFCGISFKKGYHDPIKRRPVLISIDAKDLIVSNATSDLDSAGRVTHRVVMRPSVLKRMQLLGVYRNIYLPTMGTQQIKNPVDSKIDQVQGIAPQSYMEPDDQDRELYECYCEVDLPGFEHKQKGKITGLPLPYKVTIDKEERKILEIRRNWDEEDTFCLPINRIVAYTFIPGLGFYGIGLLNILGNSTKAVTAAWRLMVDAGMFANFPGFLYEKSLAKQLTNQFRIPPGGGMPIDTMGKDIRTSILPLPYKDASPVFIQLIDSIGQAAQRVGGTAELQIGEGKQDAPVGTTLAMIEQATKLMSAVHKRLHQAQSMEFEMLKEMLKEDPSALWRHNKRSKVLALFNNEYGVGDVIAEQEQAEEKHKALFIAALNDCDLVPAADPNTSSQTERYLKVVALRQMALSNQGLDLNKIDEYAMETMGIDDPEQFFKPPTPPGAMPPSPEMMTAMATLKAAEARSMEAQTKAQVAVTDQQNAAAEIASKEKIAAYGVAKELVIHNSETSMAKHELGIQSQNDQADRDHEKNMGILDHAMNAQSSHLDKQHEIAQDQAGRQHEIQQGIVDRQHEGIQSGLDRQHEGIQNAFAQHHEGIQNILDKHHEGIQSTLDRQHEGIKAGIDHNSQMMHTGMERKHDLVDSHLDRQHEAEEAERARVHEKSENKLEREAKIKVAKAKPKPKPAATKKKG